MLVTTMPYWPENRRPTRGMSLFLTVLTASFGLLIGMSIVKIIQGWL